MGTLALLAVGALGAAARNASTLLAPATCKLAPCWRCAGEGTRGCCRAPRPKKRAATCACGAGGLKHFEAWGGSRRGAPVFFLGIAKTGSESFRKDLPRHLRPGTELAGRSQERCLSAAPAHARVMTLLREPRANVRSQWHHCSEDQDGWFRPARLPASFGATIVGELLSDALSWRCILTNVSEAGSGGVCGVGDCARLFTDPKRPQRDFWTTD